MAPRSDADKDSFEHDWKSLKESVAYAKQTVNECVTCAEEAKREVNIAWRKANEKYPGRLRVTRMMDGLSESIKRAEEAAVEVEGKLEIIDRKWPSRSHITSARENLRTLIAQAIGTALKVELVIENISKNWPTSLHHSSDPAQANEASAKAQPYTTFDIEDLFSNSDLSDVPDDMGPDPFIHKTQAQPYNTFDIEDLFSNSDLSDVPGDMGPDPFIHKTQATRDGYP